MGGEQASAEARAWWLSARQWWDGQRKQKGRVTLIVTSIIAAVVLLAPKEDVATAVLLFGLTFLATLWARHFQIVSQGDARLTWWMKLLMWGWFAADTFFLANAGLSVLHWLNTGFINTP